MSALPSIEDINADLLATLEEISKRATQLFEGSEKLRANDARAVRRLADLADEAIARAAK
jgi:hypothetical protein